MKDVSWDRETRALSGTANVIGGEPFKIVVANNGATVLKVETDGGGVELEAHPVAGLSRLNLSTPANTKVKWKLKYE
jgi:hypothetical protein